MTIDFEPSAEKLDALRRAQELEEHFRTYDQAPHITDDPSCELVRAGCLLTMAIWHGALLDPRLWSPWLLAIATDLHEDPHGVWVELAPSDSPYPTRWFADPVTEVLLRRTQPQHQSIADTLDPRRCVSAYLNHLEVPSAEERAREIERLSESRWRLRMPAIMIEVARGTVNWRPVSSENWKRIVSARTEYSGSDVRNSFSAASRQRQLGCKFSAEQTPKFRTSRNECQRRKTNPSPKNMDDFPIAKALEKGAMKKDGRLDWYRKSDSRSRCLEDVRRAAAAGGKSAIKQILNEWVVARIDTNPLLGSPRVKNVSPQHVRRELNHLIPIVRKLDSMGSPDWLRLTSEQLGAEYRLAIRSGSSRHERRAILNAIVSFQDYLEVYRADICVLFHEYDDIYEGEDKVRSILIPPAAYFGALHNLRGSSRERRMQRVMLILGYRAGLRSWKQKPSSSRISSRHQTSSNCASLRTNTSP